MLIRSNHSLHYPITVDKLLVKRDSEVDRFAPLFSYSYTSTVTEGNKYGEETEVVKKFPEDFLSEIQGTLVSWKIKAGDVLERPGIPIVDIEEPCKHEIQFGGLCTNCGQDMTEVDFITTQRNADRATVTTSHENTALRVSHAEAARASEEAKQRLLEGRKLSLVVDLDQTIIHATVDATVAQWQKDASNPNYDAVKNVLSFQLLDDGPSKSSSWYYIKLRPGLEEFLEKVSKQYELHIYTMGTRAYAQNIAKLVDPQKKFFGDRILSRDESGSLTVKSLQRLFPVDTDMVVIIDDRGDVWKWNENLIKVNPYDFFVGIGDINSSFLPKRADLVNPSTQPPPPTPTAESASEPAANGPEAEVTEKAESTENGVMPDAIAPTAASTLVVAALAGENNPIQLEQQSKAQAEVIESQVKDAPLAKMQEKLDKLDEEEAQRSSQNAEEGGDTASEPESKPRHSLLHDNDVELLYLQQHLENVHHTFFDEYESKLKGAAVDRVSQLRGESKSPKKIKPTPDDASLVPDVKRVMPAMKLRVLAGVVILFTGVIPQGTDHGDSDIGRWATSFGARITSTLSKSTTHVVAHRDRRTSKVRQAACYPQIKIVTVHWLLSCFTRWAHADETDFLIEVENDNGPHESLPFDDADENVILTPNAEAGEEEVKEDEEDNQIPPISPILEQVDWGTFDQEYEDFMKDMSDDSEMDTGDESDASTPSNKSTASKSKSTKRKRAAESVDGSGSGGSDGEDAASINGTTNGTDLGSDLQKRKKRAYERTTGLAIVTTTADSPSGLPSPDTTGPEEDEVSKANGAPLAGKEDEEDDAFDRDMEELMNEGDDDGGEE
ncbi:hypothetical protein EJ08DRAFT_596862 [Tothia fuscella]|uniref:RNA polymerase II subunit A C-terminal domain phosphatase n=1 Tax=Tothia fuscella TaxID=1048955 RepID=A0A9P4TUD4_9PEZI|nr:hypothetical protein EJ08DRAFT_596862 [Tothia fuscella]